MPKLTWKADLPDFRDWHFEKFVSAPRTLPASVDLRPRCSPVTDQGELGSCTAQAAASAFEYLHRNFGGDDTQFSRLFLYFNERRREQTTSYDSGATLRDSVKALAKWGICPELAWPYVETNFASKPTQPVYQDAKATKIASYFRVTSLTGLKTSLAAGYPVIFGFSVYASFEAPTVATTGAVPMPKSTEQLLGGHATMAVGYDEATQVVVCRNSWGDTWGNAGYFTMPYTYVSNTNLCDDFWTIRK